MGTELNQTLFIALFMLNNVEGQQDATPEGVAHWLHLSLTVSTGIAAVALLLYVWNRQIEKRGDRFRSLIENGTDLILAFGADGRLVCHSPSHYPLLGYEEDELLNAQVDDLIHPDDLNAWCSVRADQTNDDQFFLRKLRVRHKYRYLESHMVNLLDHISLRAFVVNSWDVTQRREMAEALHIAKQAAKRTSQAKSHFLANMNPEIRTPMMGS